MKPYPKNVLSSSDLLQKCIQSGMIISDISAAEAKINEIGFYRLRGYSFHLYDHATKQFKPGTTFDAVLNIYNFDAELRKLLFDMTCQVEVSLRARFCEAMLQSGDPLIYLDPSSFKDKAIFWKNTSTLTSEIARSTDVFIAHNYANHDMLTSWIHSVVVLRNICAHNSRVYNRSLSTKPKLLSKDQQNPQPRFCGLYHFLLAMKYLRPSDCAWNKFTAEFKQLLQQYQSNIDLSKLHLPIDWQQHI